MAVHPHAVAWATQGRLPRLVAGEGQRLGTVAFLTALAARADLTVVHLTADDAALAARRAGRHNTQAPAWMRAATTRAARAAASARDRGVLVVEVDSTDSSPTLVARTLAGLMQEREAPPG